MHRGAMNRVRSEEAALSRSPECRGKPGPFRLREQPGPAIGFPPWCQWKPSRAATTQEESRLAARPGCGDPGSRSAGLRNGARTNRRCPAGSGWNRLRVIFANDPWLLVHAFRWCRNHASCEPWSVLPDPGSDPEKSRSRCPPPSRPTGSATAGPHGRGGSAGAF